MAALELSILRSTPRPPHWRPALKTTPGDNVSLITVQDLADAPVRVLSLNRADKRNALNREIIQGLRRELQAYEASDRRVLVIRAEGGHFCGGADLNDPPADFFRCLPGMGVPVSKPIVCALQ